MEIKDVENLANLARIEFTDTEKKNLLGDMESILGYVKMIEEVKVGDADMKHSQKNVWREDVADSDKYDEKKIVEQFPEREGDYLKVKKIL